MHPPPDPPIPSSHPEFGSDRSVLNRSEAGLISQTTAPAVMLYFESKGFTFAADIFKAYLACHGPNYEYIIGFDDMAQILASQVVRDTTLDQVDRIKTEAKRDADRILGVTQEITSPWQPISVTDNSDVTLALGNFSVAVGSDILVQRSGDTLRAEMQYRVYAYDLYDFDKTTDWTSLDVELSVKKGLNHDMRQLEEAGWARSFKARGNSEGHGHFAWSGEL